MQGICRRKETFSEGEGGGSGQGRKGRGAACAVPRGLPGGALPALLVGND